jgi:hypothetical protein
MWWRAIYDDGSVFEEVNGVSSEAIDRDRLRRFEIRSGAIDVAAFDFDGTTKLVFRRRTEVSLDGAPTGVVVLAGWNAPDGLHLWRVTEQSVTPDPDPEVDLVPCERLDQSWQ